MSILSKLKVSVGAAVLCAMLGSALVGSGSAPARADSAVGTVSGFTGIGATNVKFSPDGTKAYVTSERNGGTVSVIDTATGAEIGVIAGLVGSSVSDIAFTTTGDKAYIALGSASPSIAIVDVATDTAIGFVIDGNTGNAMTMPSMDLEASPDGNWVYSINRFADAGLYRINTTNNVGNRLLLNVPPTDQFGYLNTSWDLAVSPDSSKVYWTGQRGISASVTEGTVRVYSSVSDQITGNVTLTNPSISGGGVFDPSPRGVEFSPDGLKAYVADPLTNSVLVIDTTTDTQIGTVANFLGVLPNQIAFTTCTGRVQALVSSVGENGTAVAVIDVATDTQTGAVSGITNLPAVPFFFGPIQLGAYDVAYSPTDPSLAYVASYASGTDLFSLGVGAVHIVRAPASCPTPAVSVGGVLFTDINGDGTQSGTDPGLPGLTVTLRGPGGAAVVDNGGNPVAPVVSDAVGAYTFANLPPLLPGQHYTATVTAPLGYVATTPLSADTGDLTTDGQSAAIGFGLYLPTDLSVVTTVATVGDVYSGGTVTFTITPSNAGPGDAMAGWRTTFVRPAGLTITAMTGAGYTCGIATGVCASTAPLAANASGGPITVITSIGDGVRDVRTANVSVSAAAGDVPEISRNNNAAAVTFLVLARPAGAGSSPLALTGTTISLGLLSLGILTLLLGAGLLLTRRLRPRS